MHEELILLGDSVAKGVVYDAGSHRYVYTSYSFLRLFCEEHGFILKDHAKFGCTLAKAQQAAAKHCAEFSGSRAVLLMLGGNDCDYDWAAVAANPTPDRPCKTPLDLFRSGYISLIRRIQESGGHPVLLGMVPVIGRRYYQWITALNGEPGIREFLIHPERIEHWNELYNLALFQIAQQCHVPLIDLRSTLLFRRDIEDFYCPDGIHPNEAGHNLLYARCNELLLPAVTGQPNP